MTTRIKEDHKRFIDVISGRSREELKRLQKTGAIVRERPKGGKLSISIPQIDEPHFVFGDTGGGLGRGPGKEGDIVGRDPQPGEKGGDNSSSDGIIIQIDMEEMLKFMEDDLKLPKMKPKPSETFDEIKIKYTNVSKVGLNSLRHLRRTMKEAIKRTCSIDGDGDLMMVPGSKVPLKVVTPIKEDFRFRQYKEIRLPSSNAVILFARDCSGSMDAERCDIVSDMSWWLDCWIKRFYKRVDRRYFVHDTLAKEVNEETFYRYRMAGGTMCSSVFELMAEQLKDRYPPEKYNIYIFYFTDGENWDQADNAKVVKIMKEKMGDNVVNMIGITQVMARQKSDSVKEYIDEAIKMRQLTDCVKTVEIGIGGLNLAEEDRNNQILNGIKTLLSDKNSVK